MSRQSAAFFISCLFLAALSMAGDFKSVVIPETGQTLTVVVPDKHFLRIRNFTQEGSATQRGVVIVNGGVPTATPTPTPSPTPTATPPTPTPSPTPTPTPTPTPAPPPQTVLTATIIDPGAARPEFIKPITIPGPVTVTVDPVPNATLFITYRRFSEATPTPTPVTVTTATPSPTPTATMATTTTSSQATIVFETVPRSDGTKSSPTPTATPIAPEPVTTPTPTPTATPSITPTPSPTPTATP